MEEETINICNEYFKALNKNVTSTKGFFSSLEM